MISKLSVKFPNRFSLRLGNCTSSRPLATASAKPSNSRIGFTTVRYLLKGELLEDGKLAFGSGAPLLMFICFLAILITLIVKMVRNGKEAEE